MSKRKILFIDRDGTLIEEPPDQQIDSLEKLALAPRVIPALLALQAAGYELVMVSNQDGLGTKSFPSEAFDAPQRALLALLTSQGIHFSAQHICPHLPQANCVCRKPEIGLVLDYLKAGDLDFAASRVIGDRESDMQLAERMGLAGIQYGHAGMGWDAIAHVLCDRPRTSEVHRSTQETDIKVNIDLDGAGRIAIATGIGFFDHMLEQLAKHSGFSLELTCHGDLEIDEHHTVEDTALALGQALREALGDKRGLTRYGFVLPMDEALAQAAIDFSGRAYCVFDAKLERERVGELPTELVPHFFHSLAQAAGATVNISVRGENTHHMIEAAFKATARALRQAIAREGSELPSTKGIL